MVQPDNQDTFILWSLVYQGGQLIVLVLQQDTWPVAWLAVSRGTPEGGARNISSSQL